MTDVTRRTAVAGIGAVALARGGVARAAAADSTGMIAVPGGKVWYRRIGSGPKTPLLLLHGGPGAGHDYLLRMAALAGERPVIFYDQLGTGRSDAPEEERWYQIARFVEEVDAVRAALGLDRIVLFGNSWGSMLAIEYMIRGAETGVDRRVEKLVLSGALASVPQAGGPYGIAYDPVRDRLWVASSGTNEVIGYDMAEPTPREVTRLPTVQNAYTLGVDAKTGRLFIAGTTAGVVQIVDPSA